MAEGNYMVKEPKHTKLSAAVEITLGEDNNQSRPGKDSQWRTIIALDILAVVDCSINCDRLGWL